MFGMGCALQPKSSLLHLDLLVMASHISFGTIFWITYNWCTFTFSDAQVIMALPVSFDGPRPAHVIGTHNMSYQMVLKFHIKK